MEDIKTMICARLSALHRQLVAAYLKVAHSHTHTRIHPPPTHTHTDIGAGCCLAEAQTSSLERACASSLLNNQAVMETICVRGAQLQPASQ